MSAHRIAHVEAWLTAGITAETVDTGGLVAEYRTCTKCGETLPLLTGFHRDKDKPKGRRQNCKSCAIAATKASQRKRASAIGEEAARKERTEVTRRSRQKPEVRERQRQLAAAYSDAGTALREAHRAEFDVIYHRIKYERGLL